MITKKKKRKEIKQEHWSNIFHVNINAKPIAYHVIHVVSIKNIAWKKNYHKINYHKKDYS